MTTGGGAIPAALGKVEATTALVERVGLQGADVAGQKVAETLAAVATALGRQRNPHIELRPAHDIAGISQQLYFNKCVRLLPSPNHRGMRPDCFTDQSPVAHTPDFRVLNLPGGYLCHFPDAPLVLPAQGDTVVSDYSSRFAGLVHFQDADLKHILADAHHVNGTVVIMSDNVRPLNYCHWIVDWLPRLAFLGERARRDDTYVIVPPLDSAYQWETLRLCGFPPARVIQLGRTRRSRRGTCWCRAT